MTQLLLTITLTLAGTAVMINGFFFDSMVLIDGAKETVNEANLHQLATVLELYYVDNGTYPAAENGVALIDQLEAQEYILNRPLDPSDFTYEQLASGRDYSLSID